LNDLLKTSSVLWLKVKHLSNQTYHFNRVERLKLLKIQFYFSFIIFFTAQILMRKEQRCLEKAESQNVDIRFQDIKRATLILYLWRVKAMGNNC